ncbi:SPOR domain-containing protein [Nitratifractor sp.]|uniref:SPOR domain-containing protein n=1 Tax=Nitratifractor sp. TaxID=2268144 RepID=UPI0025E2C72C|nr:SPOR domain-containing protein [Nitratifractor sp.]
MNDHNLDDLIIGEPDSGSKGSKSLLTLIGLVLIILIVGVFLAKLILSEPETPTKETNPELTRVVKPAAGHSAATGTPASKARPAEEIPDELKPLSDENFPKSDELTPLTPSAPHHAKAAASRPASTAKTSTRPSAAPSKTQPNRAITVTSKPKTKKVRPSKLFANQKHKAKSPAASTASSSRIYYIQVGSFKRMPNQKYLDKIKAQGYTPVIVKSGGMIKVRVGRYSSYSEAKAKLPEVKEKLGIAGFVVRRP